MEPTIYKPGAYKTPGIYKGTGGIYKGRGVYKDGAQEFVEIGGRKYPVVKIGVQKWIGYNLDYKFNGCGIGGATTTSPNAWYYDNDENTYSLEGLYKCGLLYNWFAAHYLEQNKNSLLPAGWRVPSLSDYNILESYITQSTGGEKLKALDNSIVIGFPINWNGTDKYNFNALPTGWRSIDAISFKQFGEHAHSWLSDEVNSTNAWSFYLHNNTSQINSSQYNPKRNGFTIRLVCDA